MTTREENFCFFFSHCPIFHLHVSALFFAFVAAFNTPDVLSSGFFIFFSCWSVCDEFVQNSLLTGFFFSCHCSSTVECRIVIFLIELPETKGILRLHCGFCIDASWIVFSPYSRLSSMADLLFSMCVCVSQEDLLPAETAPGRPQDPAVYASIEKQVSCPCRCLFLSSATSIPFPPLLFFFVLFFFLRSPDHPIGRGPTGNPPIFIPHRPPAICMLIGR